MAATNVCLNVFSEDLRGNTQQNSICDLNHVALLSVCAVRLRFDQNPREKVRSRTVEIVAVFYSMALARTTSVNSVSPGVPT